MPFSEKIIRLDTHFLQSKGLFNSIQALDPPNALSLGLPSGPAIKANSGFHELAVLSRTKEGTGNVISNEGRAGAGTKTGGTWMTDSDGSIYIQNPRINYFHHESMAGIDSSTVTYDSIVQDSAEPVDISAVVSIRNPVSGTLLEKPGLIRLRVTSSGALEMKQTFTKFYGVLETIPVTTTYKMLSQSGLFNDGLWHTAGFTMKATNWAILVDGDVVKEGTFKYSRVLDPGSRLYIGSLSNGSEPYTGDMDLIVYMGSGSALDFFEMMKPRSGSWISPIIDLGNEYVLESVTNGGYISNDHAVSLSIRVSPTSDFKHVETASFDLSRQFVPPDYYPNRRLYAPLRQWAEGRYAQFEVSMSRGESNFSPNLSNIDVRFIKQD